MKISEITPASMPKIYQKRPFMPQKGDFVTLNFKGFKEASEYAQKTRFKNKILDKKLCDLDLERLEGLQQGLKSFEGCSMRQIAFALTDLHSINMVSGCHNHCLHCYANSQPYVKRYPFEDFQQLCSDIKELRARLGVNPVHHNGNPYIDCYFDSDALECYLFDKNGKKHDIVDLAGIVKDSLEYKSVFDTNGWPRSDEKKQAAAEELVQKLLKDKNYKNFYQINVSINPFSPKYIAALKSGYPAQNLYSPIRKVGDEFLEEEAALPEDFKKARDKYTQYIKDTANVLYTFKPLFKKAGAGLIIRYLEDDIDGMKGFQREDFAYVLRDIASALYFGYGIQGLISKKEMKMYVELLSRGSSDIFAAGRMEKFYKVKNPSDFSAIKRIDPERANSKMNFEELVEKKKVSAAQVRYLKMIAPDGKVYMYDNYSVIPTDIRFKTSTPELKRPFNIPVKDFTVTEEMMDII